MAKILALVDTFLFKVKIGETARLYGVEVDFAQTGDISQYSLVIADANNKAVDVKEAVTQAIRQSVPVVCYLNHIQTDLAREIRALGVTEVWPQSLFVKKLPEILSQLSTK